MFPEQDIIINRSTIGDGLVCIKGKPSFFIDTKECTLDLSGVFSTVEDIRAKPYSNGPNATAVELLLDASSITKEQAIILETAIRKLGIPVIVVHCENSVFMNNIQLAAIDANNRNLPSIQEAWESYIKSGNSGEFQDKDQMVSSLTTIVKHFEQTDRGFEDVD
jgi:hypothetical protein